MATPAKLAEQPLVQAYGYPETMIGNGGVDIGSDFFRAQKANFRRLDKKAAETDDGDALFAGDAAEQAIVGEKPIRAVLYGPGERGLVARAQGE
jgi:hypothetical protein